MFGGLTLLFIMIPKLSRPGWYTITDWLIPNFEGFLPHPKWDNEQYTWGYGTRAPGPTGTITKAQALKDMRTYLLNDYNILSRYVKRKLNAEQWAAYLSFSYNLGRGDAENLLDNINSGDDSALEQQWKLYINSGGVPSSDLIARRDQEWQIWTGNYS